MQHSRARLNLLGKLALALTGCVLLGAIGWHLAAGRTEAAGGGGRVVIYTSQDQGYAAPILKRFEQESGIKVAWVFDSEAVKTVGLANRLLAERHHPQCDVFWSNEELRTRQLAAQGLFRASNGWTSLGSRSRRIVINTNRLQLADAPKSLQELTNVIWRGKVALAYPLFGTTATHFLALRQVWGAQRWELWCRALAANKPFLVDGNSVVAKMVARGDAWVGLTDSDDIAAEQREGAPLAALPINHETLLIPNTVALVRGSPNPQAAQALWHYLQRPQVCQELIGAHALELPTGAAAAAETIRPDWDKVLGDLKTATKVLEEVFLR